MGNTVFRECCSSSNDIREHVDSINNIDYTGESDESDEIITLSYNCVHLENEDMNIFKTSPGPPIFV
tara:strand:+ start:1527 stop:1727 length:201 start_codon:yes stop_codon:yes gene_type:complete